MISFPWGGARPACGLAQQADCDGWGCSAIPQAARGRLRLLSCRLQNRAFDGDSGELDFVRVAAQRLRLRHGDLTGFGGHVFVDRLTGQVLGGLSGEPGRRRDVAQRDARGFDFLGRVERHRDRRGGQRPIERLLLPHLVSRATYAERRRDRYPRQDLVVLQIVLTLNVRFRRDEEFVGGHFAFPRRAEDFDLRVERDQRGRQAGGVDEFRLAVITQDRVITVVAVRNERFAVFAFREQTETAAVIPAARAL